MHTRWTPHPGQAEIIKAVFRDSCKNLFVQAGRNWGKTELMAYCLWRYAQSHPGSENYYFSPYKSQSREILWASQRLQRFGPQEWAEEPNNNDMRLRFKNGSFIKVDGSDNVESYRGVKPKGITVFDEFKDFRPEFYESYDPNRAAHDSPLLIIGTPPARECQFLTVAKDFQTNPLKKFIKAPTQENPHISKEWLEAKKKELVDRGEEDVWQREYMAEYVPGGVSKIFPMLVRSMVTPHQQLMKSLSKDLRRIEFYVIADPAAASVFGVLFLALNPHTKRVYCLDEIYEDDQAQMTVVNMGKRIANIKKELAPDNEWMQVYDEAETWFQAEMLDHFNEHYSPTNKAKSDKESGLSLLKDIMLEGNLVISDRCEKLFWEMDNYYKTKQGKIPKTADHLIDCLRYAPSAMNYSLDEIPVEKPDELEVLRGRRWDHNADKSEEDYI